MIELVAVIVLVGILAAFAAPRFMQNEAFDARTFTDQNLSMLRYAQKLAIAQDRPVFAVLRPSALPCVSTLPGRAANRVLAPVGSNRGSQRHPRAMQRSRHWFCEGRPDKVSYWRADGGRGSISMRWAGP